MKTNLREIEIIFAAVHHQEAEKCYNFLISSGKFEENFRILPRYWIAGQCEEQLNIKNDMILIAYAETFLDFDKLDKI